MGLGGLTNVVAMASELVDTAALKTEARSGLRAAWQALQTAYPDEHCYGFGFYSHDAGEVEPIAFTEEGLTIVADRYQQMAASGDKPYLRQLSDADRSASLRWSPADSPRHGVGAAELEAASEITLASQAAFDRLCDEFDPDEDDAEIERQYYDRISTVYDTLVEVLNEARSEGLFGKLTDTLVLNVWEGDQSFEDRSAFARRCNPRDVAERFMREEEASYSL